MEAAMQRFFRTNGNRKVSGIFNIINMSIMLFISFLTIFPFYYVFIISFASYAEVNKRLVYILPTSFDLTAYKLLLLSTDVIRGGIISIGITLIGTLFSIFVTASAAYVLSKKYLPGRNIILNLIVFTMFFSGGLIPYYITIKKLGLVNNLLVMILPLAFNTFYLIIMKNYFLTIPESLEESAKIDGGNDLYIFFRIILPVSAPIIATMVLFYAVDRWNEWWTAMLFLNKQELQPLQIVLRNLVVNMENSVGGGVGKAIAASKKPVFTQGVKMAVVVVTCVPILIIYPFLQKYFAQGIMLGSIKG